MRQSHRSPQQLNQKTRRQSTDLLRRYGHGSMSGSYFKFKRSDSSQPSDRDQRIHFAEEGYNVIIFPMNIFCEIGYQSSNIRLEGTRGKLEVNQTARGRVEGDYLCRGYISEAVRNTLNATSSTNSRSNFAVRSFPGEL